MKDHLTMFALSAILIASIGMAPAFGQIVEPVTIAVDKESYSEGEKIIVTGEVQIAYGIPVTIQIISPKGAFVGVAQIPVGADKQFSKEFTAGGAMKLEGTYKIMVQYGDSRTASTTFQFAGATTTSKDIEEVSKVTATTVSIKGTTDLIRYEIIGGKLLGIIPSPEDKTLTLNIEATDDGTIKLTIPRSIFEAQDENGIDNQVYVLIDDAEDLDVEVITTEMSRMFTIEFPAGTTEIDLIGSWVIPEFGTIAVMILAVAVIAIIAVSTRSRLSIMPRY